MVGSIAKNTATDETVDYQVGGSLRFNADCYIYRRADDDLLAALLLGEYCYVFNARQMGKSSLAVQAIARLEREGVECFYLDLSKFEAAIEPARWYANIAFELVDALDLDGAEELWQSLEAVSPLVRLAKVIETVVLPEVEGGLAIFFDEIDSVLGLEFNADDLFAFIRACYNQRAVKPEYNKLTFCLLGVASPGELVQDTGRAPFNIGWAIRLGGVGFEQAVNKLTPGLKGLADPIAGLREILGWTGGQPFLTQKVCGLMQETYGDCPIPAGAEAQTVASLVRSRLIQNWEAQDDPEHLRTIRDRLTADPQRSGRLLSLYQRLLTQSVLKADGSPDQSELKLSGIAIEQQGYLQVTNRIYPAVFDSDWIVRCLARQRPYAAALSAWVASSHQDESRLLMGQALSEALQWAGDKSLSDLDYRFLSASQEWDAKMVRLELEAQEKANQMLATAQRKATQIIWLGYLSLGTCLVISVVALLVSLQR